MGLADDDVVDRKGRICGSEMSRYGISININTQMPSSVPSIVALIVVVHFPPGPRSARQGFIAWR